MNRFFLYIIFTAFIASLFLTGCSGSKRLGRAQSLYEVGEYDRAITALQRAYRRESNRYYRGKISYYLAESYRKTNQPRRAAPIYGRAIRFGYPERKAKLYQAQSLQKIGNYEEAIVLYEEYLEEVAGDPLAHNGLAASRKALRDEQKTRYEITAIRALNSRNSDYSPFIAPDDPSQIFFSSMRQLPGTRRQQTSRITGQAPSRIYTAREDSRGDWMDAQLLFENDPTQDWEDGSISITEDGRTAYFTRARYENTGPMGTEIWQTQRMGGRWGEPSKVELGPDSLIFAHPAISPDGNTLYFVSDLPGGFGGLDIWKVEKMGDQWSMPINLGADINTAGNEKFPYVRANGNLYFSSDGHPGFGGLDIFRAEKRDEERWTVTNMGRPINSESDDFGITFHRGREVGYFSSSRDNPRGFDNIYQFRLPVIQAVMAGEITLPNNEPIPQNTRVRIIGTDGSNMRINVEPAGTFNALLEPGNEYTILISAPGYFNHRERVDTRNLTASRQFELNVQLTSAQQPLVFENLQFEPGSYNLNGNAIRELERLASMLNDNANIEINITAHTDANGDLTNLVILSQQRAEKVMEFLTSRGIAHERLSARGVGGAQPLKVTDSLAARYNYLRAGEELNEAYIQRLNRQYQSNVRALNNRVEFSIVR
ncbi:PorE family type IX secretion system protein [Alkalitalea saponilacus]|uniref:Peptidoglycan-associated lipoprotein n=1 Tax=Alkalitalea saponilacus TaxID=889453 RepID=A0A1T5HF01_9BACT|nr:OmpA family protein [Alkalitalea saponilacus]ASB48072.1 hypothetical protein CDL62_02385 [Alkalitalea saponilacus]SKC19101.1 peptidoglycan-associated lipoprotein [Alkalitalea saponilacus]